MFTRGRPLTAFLSCSEKFKDSVALFFRAELERVGITGIIVSEEPSPPGVFTPDEKVNAYLDRSDMFIALCTPDNVLVNGRIETRQNIVDEIERARSRPRLRERIAVFKASGVTLPSNINPVYVELDPRDLHTAIEALRRQLDEWGLPTAAPGARTSRPRPSDRMHDDRTVAAQHFFAAVERRYRLLQVPAMGAAAEYSRRLVERRAVFLPLKLDREARYGRGLDQAGLPAKMLCQLTEIGRLAQVVGNLGSGKSSMLDSLALTIAEEGLAKPQRLGVCPTPLPCTAKRLASFADNGLREAVIQSVTEDLVATRHRVDAAFVARKAIEDGRAIVLVDALDELDEHVPHGIGRSELWRILVESFAEELAGCSLIMTTREHAASDAPGITRYVPARLAPEEAEELARRYIAQSGAEWSMTEGADTVAQAVAARMSESEHDLLLTPLHAMFLVQIVAVKGKTVGGALETLADLRVPAGVYEKFVTSVLAWERSRFGPIDVDGKRAALGALAARYMFAGKFWRLLSEPARLSLLPGDLEFWARAGVLVASADPLLYEFRHRDLALWSLEKLINVAANPYDVDALLGDLVADYRDDVTRFVGFMGTSTE